MNIIYFILAFLATIAGSMAGLGGGVIIKPVLDALGKDPLASISILSSATVFSMALVSTIKQIKNGFVPEKRMIFLAIGATLGGLSGGQLFGIISKDLDPKSLQGTQAIILAVLLIIVLFKDKLPDWDIQNAFVTAFMGFALGTIASFLGIGGGPINVAILCMFLGMTVKDAAVVSILIILFSQGAKLGQIQFTEGFSSYENLNKLWYMIPGGVIGGLLGSSFNRRLSDRFIENFFKVILVAIIILNIINAVKAFSA